MAHVGALRISNGLLKNSTSPFWTAPADIRKPIAKKILKAIWKWSKLLVFIFFVVIGLWGCFQTMWDSSITTSKEIGAGLEFGYTFGMTGDYRYDLCASYGKYFNTFSSFTWDYGPFYALFVYPGAMLVISIMYPLRDMWGGINGLIGLFVLLLIIRLFSIMVTLKSSTQNEKMQEVQGKIAEINAKYKDVKDMAGKQKKQQEIMEIYKKNKIKPFAAFEQMFITLPVFMIVYRVVTILRPLKATNLFNIWNFTSIPMTEVFAGNWVFIFFLLIVIPVQILSMKIPQWLAKTRSRNTKAISNSGGKQFKKTMLIQYVFMAVMCVVVAMSATGVGVYWFFNSIFGVIQSYVVHKIILSSRRKNSTLESKLSKLGIE